MLSLLSLLLLSLLPTAASLSAGDVAELCLVHVTQPPLLLVSRVDGVISAIELSPGLPSRWELDLGHPLLSSSSNMVLKEQLMLVPSLDGNLYSLHTPAQGHPSIEPYAKLESLLSQKHDGVQRTRWVGGKVTTTRGISPSDGTCLYSCNMEKCERTNASTMDHGGVLAVTAERRTVRLLDLALGVESWNWSISGVEMQYVGARNRASCAPPHLPLELGFEVEGGLITALFEDGTFSSTRLPGPLAHSWVLNDDHLQPVNMFYRGPQKEPSPGGVSIYLGQWGGSLYVQPFYPDQATLGLGVLNREIFAAGVAGPGVTGRQGRNTLSWEHGTQNTALAVVPGHSDPLHPDFIHRVWRPREGYVPLREERVANPGPAVYTVEDILYILQNMAGTFLLAVISSYAVYRRFFKQRPKLTTTSTETEEAGDSQSLPPTSPLDVAGAFNFEQPRPFESRFEQDFEVVRELGQGGFGKVLEAKHRISEHNYAIKVIRLPSREELRRKVEREVAAMAKLEHPNILRYYSSWKEAPTREWTRTRKYTHTSDSFDSGTETNSPSALRGSLRGGGSCHLDIESSGSAVRGEQRATSNGDETYSDIVFERNSTDVTGQSDSIVFRDERSDSIVFRDDRSDSIVFRDEKSDSIVFRDETSDSIVFRDDRSDSIVFRDEKSDSIVFRDEKSDSNVFIDEKSDSIVFRDDRRDSIVFRDDRSDSIVFRDDRKSEGTWDDSKSEGTWDDSKSEGTWDDSKSEGTWDDSKSEGTWDDRKSEGTWDTEEDVSRSVMTRSSKRRKNTLLLPYHVQDVTWSTSNGGLSGSGLPGSCLSTRSRLLSSKSDSHLKGSSPAPDRSVTFGSYDGPLTSTGGGGTPHSDEDTRECLLYIQMQLCSDQTLKEWLGSNPGRVGNMAIFAQIADAVEYIHSQNHIHRDLKPSNILFSLDGRTVKVADFGLATVMSDMGGAPEGGGGGGEYVGPSLTHNLGTRLYMCPELEREERSGSSGAASSGAGGRYDFKVDIFALGIILYELMVVFSTGMERVERLEALRALPPDISPTVEENYPKYRAILGSMVSRDPGDRPTAAEVAAFMRNSDCDQINWLKEGVAS